MLPAWVREHLIQTDSVTIVSANSYPHVTWIDKCRTLQHLLGFTLSNINCVGAINIASVENIATQQYRRYLHVVEVSISHFKSTVAKLMRDAYHNEDPFIQPTIAFCEAKMNVFTRAGTAAVGWKRHLAFSSWSRASRPALKSIRRLLTAGRRSVAWCMMLKKLGKRLNRFNLRMKMKIKWDFCQVRNVCSAQDFLVLSVINFGVAQTIFKIFFF